MALPLGLQLITPQDRRVHSTYPIAAGGVVYDGRFYGLNSAGALVAPSAGGRALLVTLGNYVPLTADGSSVVQTSAIRPANNGQMIADVVSAPVRVALDAHAFIATSLVVDSGVEVDTSGRLVILASGVRLGTVESVTATRLVVRLLPV